MVCGMARSVSLHACLVAICCSWRTGAQTHQPVVSPHRKQESALLVDGSRLGLNDTDVVFWGDADSSVRALRTSDLTVL